MKSRLLLALFLGFSLTGCAGRSVSEKNNDQIRATYIANYPKFQVCHKKYGRRNAVRVSVKFQMNTSGEIQFASIDKDSPGGYLSNPEFDECAVKIFKEIRFPAFAEVDTRGARGSFPIAFNPDGTF